ncbi:hypothetical protein [Tropicimonas aquimaris]|uniref:Uncharacterized protein n=1 Tax=Tropicimonas aquimaris TaxID=914152 RepID=A0ABW3IYF7_9RHOB
MTKFERIPLLGTEREGATLTRFERCSVLPSACGAVVLHWQRQNGSGFATAIAIHPRSCRQPADRNMDF